MKSINMDAPIFLMRLIENIWDCLTIVKRRLKKLRNIMIMLMDVSTVVLTAISGSVLMEELQSL